MRATSVLQPRLKDRSGKNEFLTQWKLKNGQGAGFIEK